MLRDESKSSLTAGELRALLAEVSRAELARLIEIENADSGLAGPEIDDRIQALAAENERLREAARRRDWSDVEPQVAAAARALSITVPEPLPAGLARQANSLQRRVNEVEIAVHEGDDVLGSSRELIADHADVVPARFIAAPILLSQAIANAVAEAPSRDMTNKIRATGEVALQFWGDIPLAAIDSGKVADLFCFISRLPRDHGRKHGNNRYDRSRGLLSKHDEIAAADQADAAIQAQVLSQPGLTLIERRARLAEQLTSRVTDATLEHHLNRFHAIVRRAEQHLAWTGKTRFMTCNEMLKQVRASVRKQAECTSSVMQPGIGGESIAMRVTSPKTRLPWSSDRLARLLSSPIYAGCASAMRRWKPGNMIIRDAYYWLPLIMMLLGTRVTEVLQLKKCDVVHWNGVFALRFGATPDHKVKTDDSVRYVPIPQLLLELGFVTWAYERAGGPLTPLFPDLAEGRTVEVISVNFMKKLRRVFLQIGIQDFDEDLYALRMTLLTKLESAGISDARRKVIAGHCSGDMINAHYTPHNLRELKADLDSVDYAICVGKSASYDFPLVASFTRAEGTVVTCDAILDSDGGAKEIMVSDCVSGAQILHILLASSSTPGRPRRGVETLSMREAAARYQDVTAGKFLQMPRHHLRRGGLEHLAAVAAAAGDSECNRRPTLPGRPAV